MRNESVAILDVRSYEIVFFLGSKGVNDTFVFSGTHTEKYDGFSSEGFFDEDNFRKAVVAAITSVRQNYDGVIGEIYVGVPSPFVTVRTKGHTLSFPSKRKISSSDIQALYESGLNDLMAEEKCIRHSAMYFTLGDNRKYFFAEDLYGVPTTLLKGALSYYFVNAQFDKVTSSVLKNLGFDTVHFLPSTLAQALYVVPESKRDGYAFLLDIGFLTSSISVVYGNGIVREKSFNCGLGTVLVSLMQALGVEYTIAEEMLKTANISGGSVPKELTWTSEREEISFPVWKINESIKYGLDQLCEQVDAFFTAYYQEKANTLLMINPISVTGEGLGGIAGCLEHISKRLNRLTEAVYPDLPYYDKPAFSSRMSLLNMALNDRVKKSWWRRFLNKLGGRK